MSGRQPWATEPALPWKLMMSLAFGSSVRSLKDLVWVMSSARPPGWEIKLVACLA